MRSQKPEARSQKGENTNASARGYVSRLPNPDSCLLLPHFFWLLASGFWLLLPLLLLSGCAPSASSRQASGAVTDYFHGNYPAAEQRLQPLATKTDENFVLNNCRLGAAALPLYDLHTAEDAFLRA